MAKRGVSAGMTRLEKILGGGLLAVYLVVLPLGADPMFDLIGRLFGVVISDGVRNAAYYYILFALTLVAFWGYLGRSAKVMLDHLGTALLSVGVGLVAFYGLNEVVWRILKMFDLGRDNLNDQAILARIGAAPYSTILIVVFLAPIIEEAIFRGYIFGNLREFNRTAAYLISCLLFALLHVWQFVVLNHDLSYLFIMVQYLVPGLVMAWTFERSGGIWGSVLLHCVVNGLSVWSVV